MSLLMALVTLLPLQAAGEAGIGQEAERLLNVIRTRNASVTTYQMMLECTVLTYKRDMVSPVHTNTLQSHYVSRSDDSVYWELYDKDLLHETLFKHITNIVFHGTWTQYVEIPNLPGGISVPAVRPGTSKNLEMTGSAARFLPGSLKADLEQSVRDGRLRYDGSARIDDRPCEILTAWKSEPSATASNQVYTRYWFDTERDAHLLKMEVVAWGDVWVRASNVKLDRFPLAGGKSVWFPVHAEVETVPDGNRKGPKLLRQTEVYQVVRGSLVLNEPIADSRFSPVWRGSRRESPGFRSDREEFAKQASKQKAKSVPAPIKIDPKSVEADLRARLKDADQQSRPSDASPDSGGLVSIGQLQIALALFAGGLSAVALLRQRSSSRPGSA